jgi:DNA-binding NarL/FixJ family response regulator
MISIVLADDHPVVRAGLRAALEAEPDLGILGEAATGPDAVGVAERLRPDILIIDVMMPHLCGLDAVGQVSQRSPMTRSIVLTLYDLEDYIMRALRNGAWGYVLKGASMDEVVTAVRQVASGRRYLSPAIADQAIEAYVERVKTGPVDIHETLTYREREVLQLAAEGCGTREIAAQLAISARTVESHRASLARKLGLRTQTDLIRYALRRGLITLEG